MIVSALINKILSLFLMMLMGFLIVRLKIVKAQDSRIVSVIALYLITPCMIISSFRVEYSPELISALLLALLMSLVFLLIMIIMARFLKKPLKLDAVEQTSAIYSNSGNLVIPLVAAILGSEWVIYTNAYTAVQLFLLWSHAKSIICGEKGIDFKKLMTNINVIALLIGVFLLVTKMPLPGPVEDSIASVGSMIGPISMMITGMIIGGMDVKKIFSFKRAWLVALLRLVVFPIPALLILKFTGISGLIPNGDMIFLITFMATATPTGTTINQMAQVYGHDAEYASAINVITTLCCIVTLPCMIALYQI